MTEKAFAPELLQDLKNDLIKVKSAYPNRAITVEQLITAIDSYQVSQTISYPEIFKELDSMIQSLTAVSPADAAAISGIAKKGCRECMFHLDDCFVNIIFLIFSSIELEMQLKPNGIRPTLRQEAIRKRLNNLSDSVNKNKK